MKIVLVEAGRMFKLLVALFMATMPVAVLAQDAEPPVLAVDLPADEGVTGEGSAMPAPVDPTPDQAESPPVAPAPLKLDLAPARRWGLMVQAGLAAVKRGDLPAEEETRTRGLLKSALAAGAAVLGEGGQAQDAAQAAAGVLAAEGGAGQGAAVALDADGQLATALAGGDGAPAPLGDVLVQGQCAVAAVGGPDPWSGADIARAICKRVADQGEKINTAARVVLDDAKVAGVEGGAIMIAPDGQMGWSFRTPAMLRAGLDSSGRERIAIYGDE